jgi:hypothetical protein
LKDGHRNGAENARLRLSGMDEFRLKALKRRFHGTTLPKSCSVALCGQESLQHRWQSAALPSAIRVLIRATELYLTDRGVKVIHASSGREC